MNKNYKLLDYLHYKLSMLERNKNSKTYKDCLRALEYIHQELEKFRKENNLAVKQSGRWNNKVFNKAKR